jgi:hypothetical protein
MKTTLDGALHVLGLACAPLALGMHSIQLLGYSEQKWGWKWWNACSITWSGWRPSAATAVFSLVASFAESTVSSIARLGHPSSRNLTLLDCRCPMKCHLTSAGIRGALSTSSCKTVK